MSLGERIVEVLAGTSLTPRDLSAITAIHFTAIYDAMNNGANHTFRPVTERVLSDALDRLEALRDAGVLPFEGNISAKERQQHLLALVGPDSI